MLQQTITNTLETIEKVKKKKKRKVSQKEYKF